MFQIAILALSFGFALALVVLFGERGFTPDLRSRRGRRIRLVGGRRTLDPHARFLV